MYTRVSKPLKPLSVRGQRREYADWLSTVGRRQEVKEVMVTIRAAPVTPATLLPAT